MNYPTYFGGQNQGGPQFGQAAGMPPRPDVQPYQSQQEQLRQQQMMQQSQMQTSAQQQFIAQQGFSPASRIVASREEAAAVTADFSGALMIFPDIAHNKVYVKQWDNGSGSAVFSEYVPFVPATSPNQQQVQQNQEQKTPFALAQDVQDLYDVVEDLTKEIDRLKRQGGKAVKRDESDDE